MAVARPTPDSLIDDYHDLLADPEIEAVSVVTHVDDHAEPATAALRAGKHVLFESPWRGRLPTAIGSSR